MPFELFKAQWYYGKTISEFWPIINLYFHHGTGRERDALESFCLPSETESK